MWQYRAALTTGGDTAPGSSELGHGEVEEIRISKMSNNVFGDIIHFLRNQHDDGIQWR